MKELTPDSKCVIYSVSSNEEILKTSGTFKGFVIIGDDSFLCIELGEEHGENAGKTRLISTNMIAVIDIQELAEVKKEEEKYPDTHYYS